MFTQQTKCVIRSIRGLLLLIVLPIILIEAGTGCAEINTPESKASTLSSFSVYVLSRGKGVPKEAREVLEQSRDVLKKAQEHGEVKRLVDRRIGLEGETRLCAEFSDEKAAERFFNQLHRLSLGVDLVNIKKEACSP